MKLDKVANSGNDEFYTPKYAIEPILKYLTRHNKIWCPFDTEQSNFVKMLRSDGHPVEATHLDGGDDFFNTRAQCDAIVSNPPYSKKAEVFERLFQLGVPFAMLVGVVGIFESERRFSMFADNKFEVMYLNRRVSYFKNYDDPKPSLNPPFSSVYITSGLLPSRIVFERIDKSKKQMDRDDDSLALKLPGGEMTPTETGSFKIDIADMKRKTREDKTKRWENNAGLVWEHVGRYLAFVSTIAVGVLVARMRDSTGNGLIFFPGCPEGAAREES